MTIEESGVDIKLYEKLTMNIKESNYEHIMTTCEKKQKGFKD